MYMNLFDQNGDPTISYSPDVWSSTADQAVSLAYDEFGSNPNSTPNPTPPPDSLSQSGYTYIDYAPPTELTPGSTLWVRIRGASASDKFPYAVRVLTAPLGDYDGWWFPLPYNTADAGDLPISGDYSSYSYQSIIPGGKLNRYIQPGKIGWVEISLP
jgi:hypothetical protein